MGLNIDTFSNVHGGFPFFKAVGHPDVQAAMAALRDRLRSGPVAIFDPFGFAAPFAAIHPLDGVTITDLFVRDVERCGESLFGCRARPVSDLPRCRPATLFVVAFDGETLRRQTGPFLPAATEWLDLDSARLDPQALTVSRRYLDPLNFATNFAFFRDGDGDGDGDGDHTRIVTANYWHGYGARGVRLRLHLLGAGGETLARWEDALPDRPVPVVVDSRAVRRRFGLPPFVGQLFVHAVGVRGHDIVKYALDTVGDSAALLSCTHDANAWPADYFAGLPAPAATETVILWVQNSHPCPIPAGAVRCMPMGRREAGVALDRVVPPFGTLAVDIGALLPDLRWPDQVEVAAGKHCVRPRYEVQRRVADGVRRRIAHVNVERSDLVPDPRISTLGALMGNGYVLPAPIPDRRRFRSLVLPTPMATTQRALPLALLLRDPGGTVVHTHKLGLCRREACPLVDLDAIPAAPDTGHMELVYDFDPGGPPGAAGAAGMAGVEVDGWLHALFRYEDRVTGHVAETSFGAHIFNTALICGREPQSYSGPPPGLSTRLFLRLAAPSEADSFCHLLYPASTPWHPHSDTRLALYDRAGDCVAETGLAIPCGGSVRLALSGMFTAADRQQVEAGGYLLIRDTTCRLFGYHGLCRHDGSAFSLDHMFGF